MVGSIRGYPMALQTNKPNIDPPMEVLQMILDLAPRAISIPDAADFLPMLHHGLCILTMGVGKHRSLDIAKLLVDADAIKDALSSSYLQV